MSVAPGVAVATARPHNAEVIATLRAYNNAHGIDTPHGEECGCLCRPPPSSGNPLRKESYLTAFRVGVCQLCVEAMLCFITLGYIYIIPSLGTWLLMSFFISIVGVSSAICCCPSQQGWKTNFNMSFVAFVIRLLLGIVCILIAMNSNDYDTRVGAYIYLVIIGLTLPIGGPFLCMTRNISESLRIVPFDPLTEFPREHQAVEIRSTNGSIRTVQPRSGVSGQQYPQAAVTSYGSSVSAPIQHAQIVTVTPTVAGNTLTNSPIDTNPNQGGHHSSAPDGGSGGSIPVYSNGIGNGIGNGNDGIPIAKATSVVPPLIPQTYSTTGARTISVIPQSGSASHRIDSTVSASTIGSNSNSNRRGGGHEIGVGVMAVDEDIIRV